jgi:hypothetical protein
MRMSDKGGISDYHVHEGLTAAMTSTRTNELNSYRNWYVHE